jgi:uncharacterized protein (DUF1501 family)
MEQLADRLEQAADTLTTLDKRMPVHAVAAGAFGAHDAGGGLPGRLGRELHEHWRAVLDARSQEAAAASARLTDTAHSVREALRNYGDTDDLVRRRLTREM